MPEKPPEQSPEQRPAQAPVHIKDVIQKTTQFFKDKGFESPRLDTELLIASALHWERMKLYLNYDYPLSESELKSCRELVRRRSTGEPVAYILGQKDFYGRTFKVSPEVLIPRPDTETLIEKTLAWSASNSPVLRILDIGTGSGCIGLTLLAELAGAKLFAIDVSEGALAVARGNAEGLGVTERVVFKNCDGAHVSENDVTNYLGGHADIVVANPPYISTDDPEIQDSVKKFEPALALFAPDEGLKFIRDWSKSAAEVVRPGGLVIFEIGHLQGAAAKEIFLLNNSFENVEVIRDLATQERCVVATKKSMVNRGDQ